ncbi:PREDICTED: lysine-specific histone demethylase 1B-like isoform X2 [Priapulus caudatus]|uniref:Lysine-specific histone demethylase 1B-like isoform X2 n=1 Tax=Priapulus caudatus TaxID=37621 RepID=A0ABM1F986_PRICU|nr:PREDICTED: lysine-specific histone demethylase 1B-like isoform X2 [Priapulus caudatus]
MSGRVKRKSLKALAAEGHEEFFPSAVSALKRKQRLEDSVVPLGPAPDNSIKEVGANISSPVPQKPADPPKQIRTCGKAGCAAEIPICFVGASDRCAGMSYTSRWYHLTSGEHFCNDCFDHFYRNTKPGFQAYCHWRDEWAANGKTEPTLKLYMQDQHLPYWVQCTKPDCTKWRQLSREVEITVEFIQSYYCGKKINGKKENPDACSVSEDHRVAQVYDPYWMHAVVQPPLLKHSPAAEFLVSYYPDGVGMSATGSVVPVTSRIDGSSIAPEDLWKMYHPGDVNKNFQPFYQPGEQGKALSVRPDIMEYDEVHEFPEYVREQAMYLGIRNLVVSLWYRNCKEWLTPRRCAEHLICRGLVRLLCVEELKRVLEFLTRKGIVNIGLLSPPQDCAAIPRQYSNENVIVIGAGTAGLAAARQLQNFGAKVTVLEARDRIGGRITDDSSLGLTVGRGAQIVNGCVNNPVTIMCEQAGAPVKTISERCSLFGETGERVSDKANRRIDFHFNAVLDAVGEWRKDKRPSNDVALYDKLMEMHGNFKEETQLNFSGVEEQLIGFHVSNLEYACGSRIDDVSALNWDQNESFAQFTGDHALLPHGYSTLLTRLAAGLNVELNTEVTSVDYTGELVVVRSTTGQEWTPTKVLVTLPLALLQEGTMKFNPPLSEEKQQALVHLGAGCIEKVALKFTHRFWQKRLNDEDFFGHVPSCQDSRGLFSVFFDLTAEGGSDYVLVSHISGPALNLIKDKTDQQVVDMATDVLRKLFPEETISDPTSYIVTHWRDDKYSKMAYSYVATGGQGEAYTVLAEEIDKKVYFAGEATNRHFPQTVTGAYLSGIREVAKMATP